MKLRYKILFVLVALLLQFAGYSVVYFSYHDSPYAEGCPEQKTLWFCRKEE